MGTCVHTAVVVTMPAETIAPVQEIALRYFGGLVTPLVVAPRNDFASFAIMPCGSKHGWDAASAHHDAIQAFLAEAQLGWDQFAVVAFGECATWAGKEPPMPSDLDLL